MRKKCRRETSVIALSVPIVTSYSLSIVPAFANAIYFCFSLSIARLLIHYFIRSDKQYGEPDNLMEFSLLLLLFSKCANSREETRVNAHTAVPSVAHFPFAFRSSLSSPLAIDKEFLSIITRMCMKSSQPRRVLQYSGHCNKTVELYLLRGKQTNQNECKLSNENILGNQVFVRLLCRQSALKVRATMEKGLHERDIVGLQDFVLLEDCNSEEAFIDNLRKRFQENLIYVSATLAES